MHERPSPRADPLWPIAAITFLLGAAYLAGLAVRDRVGGTYVAVGLLLVLVSGIAAVFGWLRRRTAIAESQAAAVRAVEQAQAQIHEREAALQQLRTRDQELESRLSDRDRELEETRRILQQELEQTRHALRQELEETRRDLQSKLREREDELETKSTALSVVQRSHEMEREWNRELRKELLQSWRQRGSLAEDADIPTLILRVATKMLDAEKGLLLSRREHGGKHELLAWHGFENDPHDSAIAERFADEVIERDKTLREDDTSKLEEPRMTAADREIRNLVAIPIYLQDEFSGVVVCANKEGGFHDYDDEVLLAIGDQAGAVLENSRLRGRLRSAYLATVRVLADSIEAKDGSLRGHCEEVSRYATAVADRLGFDSRRRELVSFASLLHDIGKIGVSERVLMKPGPLTAEEYSVAKLHPRIGYRLLRQVPELDEIATFILHHHERFDGTGYPSGLRGEDIPLESRIIAVADCFSAMTGRRPYRTRMSDEEACTELERAAGTRFDPEIVRIFIDEVRRHPRPEADENSLAIALSDPELEIRRKADEPVLGGGTFSLTDNLTLLYSRRYLQEAADAEAQRAALQNSPFAVILFGLAGIERVNDHDGYAAGDAQLEAAGRLLQKIAVRIGGTPARYSGATLALIAPHADRTDGRRIAEEILVELPNSLRPRAGVAAWTPGDSGKDVIARARAELASEPVRD